MRTVITVGLVVAVAVIGGLVLLKRHGTLRASVGTKLASQVAPAAPPIETPAALEPVATGAGAPEKGAGPGQAPQPEPLSRVKPPKAPANGGQPAKAKEPIQDPDARVALALVGDDPGAEEYWVAAINNPNLSANERQNLIEDLNEDGLSDPKHPGLEDLPLIVSRIQLIEFLAPYAMDDVNMEAFAEAYKDLINLLDGAEAQ